MGVGGATRRSVPDDHVAFVDLAEQHGSEVDGPDSVVGFIQADVMLLERIGNEEELVFEPEGAGVGDTLHDEVGGVLERWEPFGIRARGGRVARARSSAAEILMRAFVVVERAEAMERPLLGREVGARRPTGAGLERAVHAFVSAVLLGRRRPNALMLDAEAHPPDVELREAMDPTGGEGDPLSVRMARGSPNSRKLCSNTGRAARPLMCGKPLQASR